MLLWRRSITSAASVIIGFDHFERWHTHSRSWTNGNINNWLKVGIEFLWSYFMVCSKPQFGYKLLHIYFTFKFARHTDKMATAFNYSVVKIWKTSELLNNDCRSLCFFFWHAIRLNGQSFVPALVRLFHDRFIFLWHRRETTQNFQLFLEIDLARTISSLPRQINLTTSLLQIQHLDSINTRLFNYSI